MPWFFTSPAPLGHRCRLAAHEAGAAFGVTRPGYQQQTLPAFKDVPLP